MIVALSTPILEVWESVLALPGVGALDHRRASESTGRLLDAIVTEKGCERERGLRGEPRLSSLFAGAGPRSACVALAPRPGARRSRR